jgi:hypothetical protein
MTQRHLDRAVARATGESISTIRRRGFGLAADDEQSPEPPNIPQAAEAKETPRVAAA